MTQWAAAVVIKGWEGIGQMPPLKKVVPAPTATPRVLCVLKQVPDLVRLSFPVWARILRSPRRCPHLSLGGEVAFHRVPSKASGNNPSSAGCDPRRPFAALGPGSSRETNSHRRPALGESSRSFRAWPRAGTGEGFVDSGCAGTARTALSRRTFLRRGPSGAPKSPAGRMPEAPGPRARRL